MTQHPSFHSRGPYGALPEGGTLMAVSQRVVAGSTTCARVQGDGSEGALLTLAAAVVVRRSARSYPPPVRLEPARLRVDGVG